jgi:acyl transferase domain-containing protein
MNGSLTPEQPASAVKQALGKLRELRATIERLERAQSEPIAIVGMACRFPGGADDPEAFFEQLVAGVDAVGAGAAARWARAGRDPLRDVQTAGGFLDDVESFDATLFGIAEAEARAMDPQQRLLLETCWRALEDAGEPCTAAASGAVGLYVGASSDDYAWLQMLASAEAAVGALASLGSARAVLAGRVAHAFGFEGPVAQLDTMCSSSLLAVHLACNSLRLREADVVLAGGINLMLTPEHTLATEALGVLSRSGRCRSFDAEADGYVRGEGCGVVVLKRLSDALEHGDRIIATLLGSAVNHNGRSNGLTAPRGPAQRQVIERALAAARVTPADVAYIEAQATGTRLGDAIELSALGEVYGSVGGRYVGAVKSNIGHLEAASGVASLIKTALAVERGVIPPNLHFERPNPDVNKAWDGLRVALEPVAWPLPERPRTAGVSAFGMSGTNVHLIVGEAPAVERSPAAADRSFHVLTVSAKNEAALAGLLERYATRLARCRNDEEFRDVCFTSNVGRAHWAIRRAVIGQNAREVSDALVVAQGSAPSRAHVPRLGLVVGSGPVCAESVRQLRLEEPVFRQRLEAYEALAAGAGALSNEAAANGLEAQLSTLAAAHALGDLLASVGLSVHAAAGVGVGALAAAVIAGGIGPERALELLRGGPDLESVVATVPIAGLRSGESSRQATDAAREPNDARQRLERAGCDELLALGGEGNDGGDDVLSPRGWMRALAGLYERGAAIDWRALHAGRERHKVPVARYPFDRKKFWFQGEPEESVRHFPRLTQPGDLSSIQMLSASRRAPGPGEVEIEVRATGLNFKDVLRALGALPADGASSVLGLECSGEVSRVGENVRFAPGARVMALARGSLGSHVIADARHVCAQPAGLESAEAAGVPVAFATAVYALRHLAGLERGQCVLIHAAAGGVGQAALQVAQAAGARVFATASRPKWAHLLGQGVARVFDSREANFARELLESTEGRGVDVVLNSLGGEFIPQSLGALRPGGAFVEIGKIHAWSRERMQAERRDVHYHPFDLEELAESRPELLGALLAEVAAELAEGRLTALPTTTYSIEALEQGLRALAAARTIGKIGIVHDGRTPGVRVAKIAEGFLARALREQAPSEQRRYILDFLRTEFARVTVQLEPHTLSGDVGLFSLGLSSLNALELRCRLERATGSSLPATLVFEHPTLNSIADLLLDRLLTERAGGAESAEQLSDDELARSIRGRLNRLRQEVCP